MSKGTIRILAIAAAALIVPAAATARDLSPQGYAVRTGISFGPDQFQAGVHAQLGPDSTLQLRPAVDVGVGNGVRMLSLGGDVIHRFAGRRFQPYAGGGPGVNFIDVTDGVGQAEGPAVKLVAHAVAGLNWTPRRGGRRYFLEGRFGVGDTPDVRISVGMSF